MKKKDLLIFLKNLKEDLAYTEISLKETHSKVCNMKRTVEDLIEVVEKEADSE